MWRKIEFTDSELDVPRFRELKNRLVGIVNTLGAENGHGMALGISAAGSKITCFLSPALWQTVDSGTFLGDYRPEYCKRPTRLGIEFYGDGLVIESLSVD